MKPEKDKNRQRQTAFEQAAEETFDGEEISKSERKRQMHYLQELGTALVDLKKSVLNELPLSEELFDAIAVAHAIKKREARRRQLQFIGKLMRKEGEQTIAKIESTLDQLHQSRQQQNHKHHLIENWRDNILQTDGNAIEEFIQQYPAADRQWLRQMVRQYQHEQKHNRPPSASRKMFSYIRDFVEESP